MRPFGPEPFTLARSTPSSRANLRTEGLACGVKPGIGAGSYGTGSGLPASGTTVGAGRAGAGAGAGTGAGAAAGFAAGAGVPSAASSTRSRLPADTLSPTLTRSSFTVPAAGDGISIVALSDSTVISDCSGWMASPGFTKTSMTSTFLKSPMSGTTISLGVAMLVFVPGRERAPFPSRLLNGLNGHRIGFFGIDAVFLDRIGYDLGFHFAEIGERLERRDRRSEEHTSELQSPCNLVCRLLLEKKKNTNSVISTHEDN